MKINTERMMKSLRQVGEIGRTETGITRTAFSRAYKLGAEELKTQMESAGLAVRADTVGNLFGRKEGSNPELGTILIGSHLDTVVNGGLYDGNLGIAAALECMRALKDHDTVLRHPVEVVAFNAEEGGVLGGTFGSRCAMGNQRLDVDGIDDKLKTIGLRRDDILLSKIDYPIEKYVELHIEQGNILEKKQLQIGIVEGIVGITRFQFVIEGKANHAGTTPMEERKDSLVAASKIIALIYESALKEEKPFVATVGKIENEPNSVNVVPGKTSFVLEMRDMEKSKIDWFMEHLKKEAAKLKDYIIDIIPYSDKGSVYLDSGLCDQLETVCEKNGLAYQRMFSGAGHDAMELAKCVPSALFFVPSHLGISHNPEEFTSEEDIQTGAQCLLDYLLEIDVK